MFKSNFISPGRISTDGVLVVRGESEPPPDAHLVSRHVAVRIGNGVTFGPAPNTGDHDHFETTSTEMTGRIAAATEPGPNALATGTETYFIVRSNGFLTHTWSEVIEVRPDPSVESR